MKNTPLFNIFEFHHQTQWKAFSELAELIERANHEHQPVLLPVSDHTFHTAIIPYLKDQSNTTLGEYAATEMAAELVDRRIVLDKKFSDMIKYDAEIYEHHVEVGTPVLKRFIDANEYQNNTMIFGGLNSMIRNTLQDQEKKQQTIYAKETVSMIKKMGEQEQPYGQKAMVICHPRQTGYFKKYLKPKYIKKEHNGTQ